MPPRAGQHRFHSSTPRTAFLMAFWTVGKLFPRVRPLSPTMIPHAPAALSQDKRDPARRHRVDHRGRAVSAVASNIFDLPGVSGP